MHTLALNDVNAFVDHVILWLIYLLDKLVYKNENIVEEALL